MFYNMTMFESFVLPINGVRQCCKDLTYFSKCNTKNAAHFIAKMRHVTDLLIRLIRPEKGNLMWEKCINSLLWIPMITGKLLVLAMSWFLFDQNKEKRECWWALNAFIIMKTCIWSHSMMSYDITNVFDLLQFDIFVFSINISFILLRDILISVALIYVIIYPYGIYITRDDPLSHKKSKNAKVLWHNQA